jgi:hypothetical protein
MKGPLVKKKKNTNSHAKTEVLSKNEATPQINQKKAKKDKEVPRITRITRKKANRAAYKIEYRAGTVKKRIA